MEKTININNEFQEASSNDPTQASKNLLQQSVEVSILGEILALLLGLGFPIGGTYLALYYLWVSEESPVAKPIAAFVVAVWNLFLAKKLRTVFTLPIIPIPLWIFGLIMAVWFTIEAFLK